LAERKKATRFGRAALLVFRFWDLIATMSSSAAASASGSAGTELDTGINLKPVPHKIDLYGLCFFTEIFFHDKLESVYIKDTVVFFRLIQSHGQGRASSTTIVQKDPNRRDLFAFKVFLNLFRRFLSYLNHNISILLAYFHLSPGNLAGYFQIKLDVNYGHAICQI
jgi:hypothetical protein